MTVSPMTVLFTLLGGLLLAGILGWTRKQRLVVLVPRLFTYSRLTNQGQGQLAEITVFNRGTKTEEAVELSLNPSLKYEVVGANSADVDLRSNKLAIPRIGASDEITVLLLIEGGVFSKSDIVSCLSKESRGEIVSKLEEVGLTSQQRVGTVSFFVVVPLLIYAGVFGLDYMFKSPASTTQRSTATAADRQSEKDPAESVSNSLNGWNINPIYESTDGHLYKSFVTGALRVTLQPISWKRQVVTIPIRVENGESLPFEYNASLSSVVPQDEIEFEERRAINILVLPTGESVAKLKAFVPKGSTKENGRSLYVEVFISSSSGDSLKLTRLVEALPAS